MTDADQHSRPETVTRETITRETMEYDVLIVGAGPAGLATACRLAQLNSHLSICVIEKSAEIGGHILSGAVLETQALDELFPDWPTMSAPLNTPVTEDRVYWLNNQQRSWSIPHFFTPKTFHNQGNYIISLGNLCRWLGEQAEQLGVDIFAGFAAKDILFTSTADNETTQPHSLTQVVSGVIIGDMGIAADGSNKDSFTAGIELHAKYTVLSEGCHGHLGQQVIQAYHLNHDKDPQHYGLGIKELWQIPDAQHQPGLVVHTAGWPLQETQTGGGGFLYHLDDNQVAVGLVTDLSYNHPYLSPFDEFQRYKHHPIIATTLAGGKRLSYGARALTKGGIQSQPEMVFPGGLIIGDNAGTLNAAKIKGTHTAMKSGMIAAETIADAIAQGREKDTLTRFSRAYHSSWAYQELHQQRNFAPALHRWGSLLGAAYSFIDLNLFSGRLPWTLSNPAPDYTALNNASDCEPITYPKPDNIISFDKLSSVYLSNTHHEEDQLCHLQLSDPSVPIAVNLLQYDEPAQRYCPAGVYEVIKDETSDDGKRFQINAQNCIHCKTCDIKDPSQNITWVTPEGGGGPNYPNM